MRKTTRTSKLLLLLVGLSLFLAGQGKPKPDEPYAVIAGTVFQESGLAFPGATVILSFPEQPAKKLQEAVSSPRGEFAFRVPAGEHKWLLTASRKGFVTATKEVEIVGQEQIHATLILEPESKK